MSAFGKNYSRVRVKTLMVKLAFSNYWLLLVYGMQSWNWLGKYHFSSGKRNFLSHITYFSLMLFIAYAFKGQVHVFVGWVKIVYAQIRKGLGMHLVTYSNHDTVPFLLIVPIKGWFVWDGIHCVYIYQRLHDFLTFLEYLGNPVHFSIYKGWNFPFLLGDILNIPLKGWI